MAVEILLPQWGMEMQDGTIISWLKQEGDPIQEGEPLVEIETEKIETELESIASGIIAHILVPEGATVPIRTVLAIVAEPGEEAPRPAGTALAGASTTAEQATSAAAASPPQPPGQVSVQVLPAARRLATQHGVNLAEIQGSGPGGRILLADVEAAIQTVSAVAAMVRSQVRPVVEALTYQASIRPDRPVPVSRM